MAATVVSVDVERSHDEVFAYVTDPARFAEWQAGVVGGSMEGNICKTTRRIGGSERTSTSTVTKNDPPAAWGVHGTDGPIRATVDVRVEALEGTARSRVTIGVDFEGHGIGKVLVPLVVRRQARKEMPANVQRLKERLEARA